MDFFNDEDFGFRVEQIGWFRGEKPNNLWQMRWNDVISFIDFALICQSIEKKMGLTTAVETMDGWWCIDFVDGNGKIAGYAKGDIIVMPPKDLGDAVVNDVAYALENI